jgi:ubiquinone/menaquinone biosynthesis C-methylase UbiE
MRRRRETELMDDPNVDQRAHRLALAALRRSNRWLGCDAVLVRTLAAIAPAREARLLEIGAGGGGLIEALADHDRKMEGRYRLIGLDRSLFAIADAQAHIEKATIASGPVFAFVAGDALRLPFASQSVDVAICSLLLHHFDPDDAVRLLQEAARVARHGVVIGDLDRSALAWLLTCVATRLMSRSRIFHVDGPRSVRAAYRPTEVLRLAEQAGLATAIVRNNFPFRWTMIWQRKAP